MEMLLKNKVAIVTGASRGIGAAIVRIFIEEGAKVIIGDVLQEPGQALAEELGDKAFYFKLDVSQEQSWKEVVALANRHFGGLDILVNNAGILHYGSIADTKPDDYMRVVGVNQFGTFLGMQAVIPSLKVAKTGTIVNLSSTAGLRGFNGMIAYSASKWAVRGMTKVAAAELGRFGIRVNSVHPGGTQTAMSPVDEDGNHTAGDNTPLARIGQPEEIANMVTYLASDKSSYSTGAEFIVDGGSSNCFVLDRLDDAEN
jgi:3alpha(or 20beta)-hydroxysteroid dehydrogenase